MLPGIAVNKPIDANLNPRPRNAVFERIDPMNASLGLQSLHSLA